MDVVQGYGNNPRIANIANLIVELRNNTFPANVPANSLQECCTPNDASKVFWIVILWYDKPIAQTALKWTERNGRGYWYMFNFGVREFQRGRGLGKKLFELVKEFAREHPIIWGVEKDNIGAQLFYRKMGAKDFESLVSGELVMVFTQVNQPPSREHRSLPVYSQS